MSEIVGFSSDDAERILDATGRELNRPERPGPELPAAARQRNLIPRWVKVYHPKPVRATHIFPIEDLDYEYDVADSPRVYRGRFTIYDHETDTWSDEDEDDDDPDTFKFDRCWVRGAHGEALEFGRRYLGLIQAIARVETGLSEPDQEEGDDWKQSIVIVGFPDSFPALLTTKTYPEDGIGSTKYSWIKMRDTDEPAYLTWINEPDAGDPDHWPAYEVNGIDLPVPMIARLRRSATNDAYLIDMAPRWEFVRLTTESSGGATVGYIQIRDQNTHGWFDGEQVLVIDATLP